MMSTMKRYRRLLRNQIRYRLGGPPHQEIMNLLGKINSEPIFGFPKHSLLFLHFSSNINQNNSWDITIEMTDVADIMTKVIDKEGKPLYNEIDFSPIKDSEIIED